MAGDGGIDDGIGTNLNDVQYRYELYSNWKANLKSSSPITPQQFAKNHNFPFPMLEEIVRDFDSNIEYRID
jgi:hypothetical protein